MYEIAIVLLVVIGVVIALSIDCGKEKAIEPDLSAFVERIKP